MTFKELQEELGKKGYILEDDDHGIILLTKDRKPVMKWSSNAELSNIIWFCKKYYIL